VESSDPGDPGEFGRLLRRLRESASLSQEELAERATLTAKAVGALERGERRRPYPNTVRALSNALGLDDETSRLLAEAARPAARAAATAPVVAPATPAAVPVPPTAMVGREAELDAVTELLLEVGTRVVTITGPGGVGKTRLAWAVAARLVDAGRELVVVELGAVRRVDLVVPTIARGFGLETGSEDLIGSIAAIIGDRTPILVLDNLEHLLDAAPDLADLVQRSSGVTVLATSRAPLRIRAEREVPLGPLPIAAGDDVGVVRASAAARMFADRARAVVPDFTIDRDNAATVAAICRRLDGLPLALELAAAHAQYLPPAQLLDRLDHAVGSARLRDLPARQQTMRATLDWSYHLLTEDEQTLLSRLAVFAGGFDLEAAEQVAGGTLRNALTALEGLLEQSLVVGPELGPDHPAPRYRLLEPVRDDAGARLTGDEAVDLQDRHADYFVALAVEASGGLRSPDLPYWLDRLEADHANLRATLSWLLQRGDVGRAADLGAHTWLYWAMRGHAGEGLAWWERVVTLEPDDGDDAVPARAAAHVALAGLRLATGAPDETRTHGRAAIAAGDADARMMAEARLLAALGAAFLGDLDEASALIDGGGTGDAPGDDPWLAAHIAIARAQVALLDGDVAGGLALLDTAERLARRDAGQFTLGTVLNLRTTVATLLGDDAAALASAAEALALAAEVRTTWTLVYTLSNLGIQAARRGLAETAVELFAAAERTAEVSLLTVAFRPDRETAEAALTALRSELSAAAFDRAWERGRTLRTGDVLELIPEITRQPAPS
jgi:predicted ATPase/transcriptional regulator with XRE-family HTH domain